MNATKKNIGKNKHSRRSKANTATPTVGEICRVDETPEECGRNTERQAEIRTDRNASDGFLKWRFLPKQEEKPIVERCKTIAKTERDFYKSLSFLSKQYNVEPMYTKDFVYPYNISLAMWDMEAKLEKANIEWNSFKLVQNNKKTFFVRKDCFRIFPIYYIPIVPLYQMLKEPNRKKNAQLLLSVCSYLYHIADIPYYRQQNSYLFWIYEMHEDWIDQNDEDEENVEEYKSQLKISEIIGDKMEQKLFNHKNLELFGQRLNNFKKHNDFDHNCWQVASDAFALYSEYPSTTIFRNKPIPEQNPYDDDYSSRTIEMDMYISFVANTEGCLYRHIEESVNVEFNEYGSVEEPTIYTPINSTFIKAADFDFEHRIFTLLDNLYKVLTT